MVIAHQMRVKSAHTLGVSGTIRVWWMKWRFRIAWCLAMLIGWSERDSRIGSCCMWRSWKPLRWHERQFCLLGYRTNICRRRKSALRLAKLSPQMNLRVPSLGLSLCMNCSKLLFKKPRSDESWLYSHSIRYHTGRKATWNMCEYARPDGYQILSASSRWEARKEGWSWKRTKGCHKMKLCQL